jgi:hypothetical protein
MKAIGQADFCPVPRQMSRFKNGSERRSPRFNAVLNNQGLGRYAEGGGMDNDRKEES